jgi:hypothetical protein
MSVRPPTSEAQGISLLSLPTLIVVADLERGPKAVDGAFVFAQHHVLRLGAKAQECPGRFDLGIVWMQRRAFQVRFGKRENIPEGLFEIRGTHSDHYSSIHVMHGDPEQVSEVGDGDASPHSLALKLIAAETEPRVPM